LLLDRVTTIMSRYLEQHILCPFDMHQHTAVSLRRGEAVKLEGWVWDCLAGTGVSRSKGKCDGNKEV